MRSQYEIVSATEWDSVISFVGPSKDLSLTFGNYFDDLHDVVVLCGQMAAL